MPLSKCKRKARRQKALLIEAAPPTPPEKTAGDAKAEDNVPKGCNACDCNDFEPNAFKKGKCNNCFHFHGT